MNRWIDVQQKQNYGQRDGEIHNKDKTMSSDCRVVGLMFVL